MKLSEKIIKLRKGHGWSQDDLAEQMDVSRQSVSKWENGESQPDINKILRLSEIFSVSTDYLLKNDDENVAAEKIQDDISSLKKVTKNEAEDFLLVVEKNSGRFAFATLLCVLSPSFLLVFLSTNMNGNLAAGLGVTIILALVACAVGIFIYSGNQIDKYQYIEKEPFQTDSQVTQIAKEKKDAYEKKYSLGMIIGVALCIMSAIPLIITASLDFDDKIIIFCVAVLLMIVCVAVFLFVKVNMINDSYKKLLQIDEFTFDGKKASKKAENIGGIYWGIITAAYLASSFLTMQWGKTWIIWPCAGVFFGVVTMIINMKNTSK